MIPVEHDVKMEEVLAELAEVLEVAVCHLSARRDPTDVV